MITPPPQLLLYLTLLLCIAVTIRSFVLRKRLTSQNELLQTANARIEALDVEVAQLKVVEKRFHDFSKDLTQAELSTEIQRFRHATAAGRSTGTPPERYQYIHSLNRKGIPSAEIASILAISPHEADQLVKLANLSQH
jgi:hypothetical protein